MGNLPVLIVMFKPTRPLSPNIETWPFDRVFDKENFYGKGMEKSAVKIGHICTPF